MTKHDSASPSPESTQAREQASDAAGERLARGPFVLMAAGLAASYGTLAYFAGKFLVPAESAQAWLFVCPIAKLAKGESLIFKIPGGESVAIARNGDAGVVDDFVALSSTCPHLGCQVYWEDKNARFFCPCHNGAFDKTGKATEGPPAQAGTDLKSYPLRIEQGLLYIEVPAVGFANASHDGGLVEPVAIRGPGHDACLAPRNPKPLSGETEV